MFKALLLIVLLLLPLAASPAAAEEPGPRNLDELLDPVRKKYDLPALGALVLYKGKIVGLGVVGVRKYGTDTKATTADQFHIGSCTKSMTATMIARLVEQGKLRWDQTIGESFPEFKVTMHPDYRAVTLEQLLQHRAGFPPANNSAPEGKAFAEMHRLPGTPQDQRHAYVGLMLKQAPNPKPGTKYQYSNAGYTVAAAMAEKATNTSWEDLLRQHLFKPLMMDSAGFGAMGTRGRLDQPLQHADGSKHRPVEPGRLADNPDVIAPGGKVHVSLADWSKFVQEHLRGARGEATLLKPETFTKLHTPAEGQDYAMGWIAVDRPWGDGRVLTHAGSNTMNYAVAWLAPRKDFAVLIVTNQGGGDEQKACDDVASLLIREFLK